MKLTPIEKLAREICWAGFAVPEAAGLTKAAYWKKISEDARDEYRKEAERFVFILSHISADLLNEIETFHVFRPEDWKLEGAR